VLMQHWLYQFLEHTSSTRGYYQVVQQLLGDRRTSDRYIWLAVVICLRRSSHLGNVFPEKERTLTEACLASGGLFTASRSVLTFETVGSHW